MNTTIITDADKLSDILETQRTALMRKGAPSLAQRRADLKKFKSAMIGRRKEIEDAVNTDFGHCSRHETAIIEMLGVIEGIRLKQTFGEPSNSQRNYCPILENKNREK